MNTNSSPLSTEKTEFLAGLAQTSNANLEAAAAANSSQAFNVGCSVGLGPGLLIILLVFFFSKGSIAATAISVLLVAMLLVLFANVVAYISRSNAVDRIYSEQIKIEIDRSLREEMLSQKYFNQVASQILPEDAALQKFLVENNQ